MDEAEALLDRIYECAFLPEAWPSTLDGIAAEGGAAAGLVFTAGGQFADWRASASLEGTAQQYFDEGWVLRNPRTPFLLAGDYAGFVPDSEVFTDLQLAVDPLQVELLLPAGFGREVATFVRTPSGENIVISLHRPFEAGRFGKAELLRLDGLRPHLARATFLATRLRLERMRAAVNILEAIGLPAAVLGTAGKVLASNTLLDRVAHLQSGAFSRLALHNASAQRKFNEAIIGLHHTSGGRQLSLLLTSEDEHTPDAILHLVPLRREARDMMTGALAVAVVSEVAKASAPSAALLHSLFDLTAAEAKVARGLLTSSIGELAASSGVSAETIRTQLKSVMRKTGTRRQSTLTALLARISLAP